MTVKLVIFDVDGTIFQTYSWQYLHESLGTWDQASEYSNRFFNKEISYEEWAQLDGSLWKDQSLENIERIVSRMPYTRGAKETFGFLKREGIRTFLLSAGLARVAERVHREIGTNGYKANRLIARDGRLTGKVEVNVSFFNKHEHLPAILGKFSLTPEQCGAVGDDPTLIPLFRRVATSIAFNPTDKNVERHADFIIKSNDLRSVLPYLTAVASP